jgi:hypothetical protein
MIYESRIEIGAIIATIVVYAVAYRFIKFASDARGEEHFDIVEFIKDLIFIKRVKNMPVENVTENGGVIKSRDPDFVYVNNRTNEISTMIRNHDPGFDKAELLKLARNTFLALYMNYGATLMDKATVIELENVFNVFRTSQYFIESNTQIPYEIDIKSLYMTDYVVKDGFEYITVIYYVELKTGQFDDGTGDSFRQFEMKFVRFVNDLVSYVKKNGSIACPNCGGSAVSIIRDGVCEYCGYSITLGGHEFVPAGFKKVLADGDIYGEEEDISPLVIMELEKIKRDSKNMANI